MSHRGARTKLSTIIDRPVRILETGTAELEIRDVKTDEKIGLLIMTANGTHELYDEVGNFFEDDTE